jgi:hypothetical protein
MSGKPGKQALHIEAWLYGLLEQRAAVEGRTVEDLAQALIGNGLIAPHATSAEHLPEEPSKEPAGYVDTVVVAAGEENWVKMFMHGYWDCIQVSETRRAQIRYIAVYRKAQRSITHVAEIVTFKPSADEKKAAAGYWRLEFSAPQEVGPVAFTGGQGKAIQGRQYTTKARLDAAHTLNDLKITSH